MHPGGGMVMNQMAMQQQAMMQQMMMQQMAMQRQMALRNEAAVQQVALHQAAHQTTAMQRLQNAASTVKQQSRVTGAFQQMARDAASNTARMRAPSAATRQRPKKGILDVVL